MSFQRTIIAIVCAISASATSGALPTRYVIQELPVFCNPTTPDDATKCGSYSYGYDINDNGEVTGFAQGAIIVDSEDRDGDGNITEEIRDFSVHAFRWSNNTLSDLGDLEAGQSYGNAINNSGVIVGRSNIVAGTTEGGAEIIEFRGFAAEPGEEMVQIEDPASISINSLVANDIDSAGYIVGTVGVKLFNDDDTFYTRGFVRSPVDNTVILIPSLEETTASVLRAIESARDIAVGYSIKNEKERAISVSLSDPSAIVEIGDLGGGSSSATDVNQSGVIVGASSVDSSGVTEGFFYTSDGTPQIRSIGVLNPKYRFSSARAINDAGTIVGVSVESTSPTTYRAIAYDISSEKLVNLNNLIDCSQTLSERWTLVEAVAINNSGQIIGYGAKGNTSKGFLLTPDTSGAEPVACAPSEGDFENQSGGGGVQFWLSGLFITLLLFRRKACLI